MERTALHEIFRESGLESSHELQYFSPKLIRTKVAKAAQVLAMMVELASMEPRLKRVLAPAQQAVAEYAEALRKRDEAEERAQQVKRPGYTERPRRKR